MEGAKSLVLRRKGETDGFGERFGEEIPDGSLLFIEGKEGVGKSIFCQRFCASILENGNTCSYGCGNLYVSTDSCCRYKTIDFLQGCI